MLKWRPRISPRAFTSIFTSMIKSGFKSRRSLVVGIAAAGFSVGLILAGRTFLAVELARVAGSAGYASRGVVVSSTGPPQRQWPEERRLGQAAPGPGREQGQRQEAHQEAPELMIDPVGGRVAVGFGWVKHPLYGDWRYNGGWDIATEAGERIRAALSGHVVEVGEGDAPGRRIVLQHDNDIQTVYGHCETILVEKGEEVRQGDIIGQVRDEGDPIGPYLHFEVHRGGKPLDPGAFLRLSPQR